MSAVPPRSRGGEARRRSRASELTRGLMAIALPLLWLALVGASEARADCGTESLRVSGSAEEVDLTCAAVADVQSYFAAIGFTFRPALLISFDTEVSIEIAGPDRCRRVVRGAFDPATSAIHMTSALAPDSGRRPWGLPWDKTLCRSVLVHELTHAATCQILVGGCDAIGVAWRELVAYAVQLELMEPTLRAQILGRYAAIGAFDTPEQVNRILHALDPDAFGVQAFLFVKAYGGPDLIRRILTGTAPFPTEDMVLEPF